MKGTFYAVGVGPGDPELLTVKAVRVLGRCPVVAAPQTGGGETLALDIAAGAVDLSGKTVLKLPFAMSHDAAARAAAHRAAADAVKRELDAGRDVAMPNLGDVSIYATGGYLIDLLRAEGYQTVMVPGVPSFCAVAAALGTALARAHTPLHILPTTRTAPLPAALDLPGTKVLMKSGRSLPAVLDELAKRGALQDAALVRDCGLATEQIWPDLTAYPREQSAGYFATVIVKDPAAPKEK